MAASGLRRLWTPIGGATILLLLFWDLVILLGPGILGDKSSEMNPEAIRQGPSWDHVFGTDQLGRDILARTITATRQSMSLALLALGVGGVLGVLFGTISVTLPRALAGMAAAAIRIAVGFPGILVAMFLCVIFGVGALPSVFALGIALAPGFARLTYNLAAGIANADYVRAARLLGVRGPRLIRRHFLPNIADPLIAYSVGTAGQALLAFAALSYLGFGVQSPSYDWGRMLNEGLQDIYANPLGAAAPSLAIVLAGITFVLAGEWLVELRSESSRRRARGSLPGGDAKSAAASVVDAGDREEVLKVEDLRVVFPWEEGVVEPVNGISLTVSRGEVVGIVGESGSGKSLAGAAVAGLTPYPGQVHAKTLRVAGQSIRGLSHRALREALGAKVVTIFQDPMASLNPALRIGTQLAEVAQVHAGKSRKAARQLAATRLGEVRMTDPELRLHQVPAELSGGMRQRTMIAMGLMGAPMLIIADEPTTALDATVQDEVLTLLEDVKDEIGAGMLFISHDIGVVARIASRVVVMYSGRIVEELSSASLLTASHPYTRSLVSSVPDMTTDRSLPLTTIEGAAPDPGARPPGCAFEPRCPLALPRCRTDRPELVPTAQGAVACWNPQADGGRADAGASNLAAMEE